MSGPPLTEERRKLHRQFRLWLDIETLRLTEWTERIVNKYSKPSQIEDGLAKGWIKECCGCPCIVDRVHAPDELVDALQIQQHLEMLRLIRISRNLKGKDTDDAAGLVLLGYALGKTAERLMVRPFEPLVLSEKKRRIKAAKGGRNTRKWTPKVESLARRIFAEEHRGKVSVTNAAKRTAARLLKDHGTKISYKLIADNLGKQ
jgi:hypothetical protein